ncbi:MAG: YggT family protein [Anaerolineae bacterium]|nr:YggT family protein [Anaerolineae bacterium]
MTGIFWALLKLLFSTYSFAIIIRSFLPWLGVSHYHPVMRFLIDITEPLLAPLRRFIPSVGGLDFSPMVALLVVWAVEQAIRAVFLMIM